ncbi:MAG: DUF1127 domain-containing protein [Acidiferrobacterales bacterium]
MNTFNYSATLARTLSRVTRTAAVTAWESPGEMLSYAVERLLEWQERANQRYALRELDDHLLKDIGISRADAAREAGKPFWKV